MVAPKPIKSIRDTFLYGSMNKGSYLDKIIKNAISKAKILKPDDLTFEVNTINKYYKFGMRKAIMDKFEAGILKPVVLPPGVNERIPASVPFMLYGSTEIGAYVFIDNHAQYNKTTDTYSIDPKKLYCLLESAYIATLVQKNARVLSINNTMASEGSAIFAHMFIRVLNKKYALNVDRRAYAKVLFLAAKFFMLNVLGMKDSESVTNYALKASDADNPMMMKELEQRFDDANASKDIAAFVRFIKENAYMISQSLAELTLRDYLTDFVNIYQSSTIFALEHLSYFLFVVDSVILGAYLNNQAVLEDVVGKSGAKLYTVISTYQD